MNLINCIQFIFGIGFLLAGLAIFAVELIGVFKFKYVLNRMHAAAMGDTIGIGMSLFGLIILCGLNYTSLKMALVIVFLWLASPVSSHLISRLEVTTNEEIDKFCDRRDIEAIEEASIMENGGLAEEKSQIVGNRVKITKKSPAIANSSEAVTEFQTMANQKKKEKK
uniref:cation:proton antiporter n=1 Tax=Agathobacter sp. TaxID=2021311 RepID=UPI004055BED8